MYQLTDSDSVDSDEGIRYKTDSIRNKRRSREMDSPSRKKDDSRRERRRSRSRSPRHSDHRSSRKSKKQKTEQSPEHSKRKNRRRSKSRSKSKSVRRSPVEEVKKHKEKERDKRKSRLHEEKKELGMESTSFGPTQPPVNNTLKVETEQEKKNSPELPLQSSVGENTQDEEMIVAGPALPPHLIKQLPVEENTQDIENVIVGPALPPHLIKKDIQDKEMIILGPILPLHLLTLSFLENDNSNNKKENDTNNAIVGPALPPHLLNKEDPIPPSEVESNKIIGPAIPPHLRQKLSEDTSSISIECQGEEEVSVSDDDEVYGPVPAGEKISKAHVELEERALKLKIDQLGGAEDEQPTREEWMLTLPEAKASKFGLGPRQFRAKAGPDLSDRSSWTDTPEDKAKKKAGKVEPKVDLQREAELRELQKRDEEQEAIAKKNKKYKESLVDMHTKKLKQEKKKEEGPAVRRPFSREIDLQVNRFDEAQKKAVLKKAQLLDNRFSAGESKFL